jgi:hypothetical protein
MSNPKVQSSNEIKPLTLALSPAGRGRERGEILKLRIDF